RSTLSPRSKIYYIGATIPTTCKPIQKEKFRKGKSSIRDDADQLCYNVAIENLVRYP
ncbi:unnamed protein product, partial [Dovyalis caffra]